jgi:hypothetical protein
MTGQSSQQTAVIDHELIDRLPQGQRVHPAWLAFKSARAEGVHIYSGSPCEAEQTGQQG